MGAQRWCILGVTVLLLACEVAVSQLCHSLILLMDSFHTFYILMFLVHQALTHRHGHAAPPPASPAPPPQAPPSSAPAPVGPPAISPAEPLAGTASGDPGPAETPPPPLGCGLSYSGCRIQVVGGFLAALFLASLCVSGLLEIIGLFLGPKPVRHHLLLAAVSGGSLFHKMLVLWWSWEREQTPKGKSTLHVRRKGNVCVKCRTSTHCFLTRRLAKLLSVIAQILHNKQSQCKDFGLCKSFARILCIY